MIAMDDDVIFQLVRIVRETFPVVADHPVGQYFPVRGADLDNVPGLEVLLAVRDSGGQQAFAMLKNGGLGTGIDCDGAMGVVLNGDPALV